MYRRPARDRNYEFWGDQVFYGENPPQAAVLTWLLKKPVGEVALRISDATGRQIREISGPVLANSNKEGMQSACWDLRVQPVPAPAGGRGGDPPGRGGAGEQGGRGGPEQGGRGGAQNQPPNPFGAGCGGGGGGFGGGGFGFGGGGGNPGPFVLPGVYNVSLIVDGKSIETRPLRVMADPEVSLTEVERKRMYDMAIELHDLQRRVADVNSAFTSVNRQIPGIQKTIEGRSDLPADVKSSFESVDKSLLEMTARLAPPAGGRGGGGGGGGGRGGVADSPVARLAQAKNGLMGGMPATSQTLDSYKRSKAEIPKVLEEAQGLLAKLQTLSAALAKHNITLTVPAPAPTFKPVPNQ